jgi:hypothetical protein
MDSDEADIHRSNVWHEIIYRKKKRVYFGTPLTFLEYMKPSDNVDREK